MGYSDVAALAIDADFRLRTVACHAGETFGSPQTPQSEIWQRDHGWEVASAPGFGDAYASALAGSVDRPGNDPAVISDDQILSAVQAIITAETVPVP